MLTAAAERHWQRNDRDQYYFSGRYRGSFRRQIQLGDGLNLDQLEADLHDGVDHPHSRRGTGQAAQDLRHHLVQRIRRDRDHLERHNLIRLTATSPVGCCRRAATDFVMSRPHTGQA